MLHSPGAGAGAGLEAAAESATKVEVEAAHPLEQDITLDMTPSLAPDTINAHLQ